MSFFKRYIPPDIDEASAHFYELNPMEVPSGLLCGASVGITYEKLQKHTLIIDVIFLRLVLGYGPEASEAVF